MIVYAYCHGGLAGTLQVRTACTVAAFEECEADFTELLNGLEAVSYTHLDVYKRQGSRHANMKELRFGAADGEWRVALAFDTKRKAILLVAGDKSGVSEKRFYRELIRKADDRFDRHLARLKKERK